MFKHYLINTAASLVWIAAEIAVNTADAADRPLMVSGVYVNDAQNSDGIKAAIKANIASMNFVTRPLARKVLEGSNLAYRRVVIAQTATEIVVTFDTREPYSVPVDGSAIQRTDDNGETSSVHASWRDRQLLLTSSNKYGQRVNAFRFSDDQQTLTLNVTVASPRLETPLRYELVFRRQ